MVVDRRNFQAIDEPQTVDLRTFGRRDHCDSIDAEIWRVFDVPLVTFTSTLLISWDSLMLSFAAA